MKYLISGSFFLFPSMLMSSHHFLSVQNKGWGMGRMGSFFDDITFVLNLLRARFRFFRPLDLDQANQLFSSRLLPMVFLWYFCFSS